MFASTPQGQPTSTPIPTTTGQPTHPLDSLVCLFSGVTNPTPTGTRTLRTMLTHIKKGTYQGDVDRLRNILNTQGKAPYKEAKEKFIALTPCGTFTPTRAKAHIVQHTGVVHGDLDNLDDMQAVKAALCADSHTLYCFVSPSGVGLKVGVSVPIVEDDTAYKISWQAVANYHREKYNIWWDQSGKDISRMCFVSSDPALYCNPEAALFVVSSFVTISPPSLPRTPLPPLALDDTALIDKAMRARDGEKFSRLWEGNIDGYVHAKDGTPDASAADEALLCLLAWWTRWDVARTEALYHQSALADTVTQRHPDTTRYLQESIAKALAKVDTYYEPEAYPQHSALTRTQGPQAGDDTARLGHDHENEHENDQAGDDTAAPASGQTPGQAGDDTAAPASGQTPGQAGDDPPAQKTTRRARKDKAAAAEAPTGEDAWKALLIRNKDGVLTENVSNISLILEHDKHWRKRLWLDVVRQTPMLDERPLNDQAITSIGRWLGETYRMPVRNLRLVERCAMARCALSQKDLLREWVEALPAWDGAERLPSWLSDVAESDKDAYGMDVSRLLPVSMIARALDPGCQYRYVVILEGEEDTGKSKLVRSLASPEWYVELSMDLETKEAHMMLQGAWVAELAELHSLGRTRETRLKAFITMREDAWVPKYSNFRTSTPRRTIFIGTSNESTHFSETGNTRFLPIKTGTIAIDDFLQHRDQIFAEARDYYQAHPLDWWKMSEAGAEQAVDQREQRRVPNVYEDDLGNWLEVERHDINSKEPYLFTRDQTSWLEIARYFLKIPTPEGWSNMVLQKQISTALRALKWEIFWPKDDDGNTQRKWRKKVSTP